MFHPFEYKLNTIVRRHQDDVTSFPVLNNVTPNPARRRQWASTWKSTIKPRISLLISGQFFMLYFNKLQYSSIIKTRKLEGLSCLGFWIIPKCSCDLNFSGLFLNENSQLYWSFMNFLIASTHPFGFVCKQYGLLIIKAQKRITIIHICKISGSLIF